MYTYIMNRMLMGTVAKPKGLDGTIKIKVETDDFDNFIEKAKSYPNIEYVKREVQEGYWGQRVLHLYDPDGHIVEVGERFSNTIKRFAKTMTVKEVAKRCGIPVADVEKYLDGTF